MEPNRFLFKLTAILLQYIFTTIVFIPIVYAVHLIKYNFHTQEIVFIRILFFAVAFALPFVVANAFSFAKFEHNELTYYLKPNQKHTVIVDRNADELLKTTVAHLSEKPFWKFISQSENKIHYSVKNIILKDEVFISAKPISDIKTELTILSKPTLALLFLDYGRNYQNIIKVLLATKP